MCSWLAQVLVAALTPTTRVGPDVVTVKGRIKATDDAFKALGREDDDREERGSIASTAAPSTAGTSITRLSFASTASVASTSRAQLEAKLEERRRKVEGLPPVKSDEDKEDKEDDGQVADEDAENPGPSALHPVPEADAGHVPRLLTAVEGFRSCLCPRCLRSMPLRRTRPRASIYSGGVRCDYSKIELMGEADEEEDQQSVGFSHCKSCWFDLCQQCAYKEMREVWWGED